MRTAAILLATLVALTQIGAPSARASVQPLVTPELASGDSISGVMALALDEGISAKAPLPVGVFEEIKKLTASDAALEDEFGFSVAIAADTVVVGAIADDAALPSQPSCQSGSAYVFLRHQGGANNWGQAKKLIASDAACFKDTKGTWYGDEFGYSASISGDTLVIGAHQEAHGCLPGVRCRKGAAYVFERNQGGANAWGEVKKLIAPNGLEEDLFGNAVSISGDTIVVGARGAQPLDAGAVYVFERNQGGANQWGFVKMLLQNDPTQNDQLGFAVAISGDKVLAGAAGKNGLTGAAYVFARNVGGANNWGQAKKLTASDAAAVDVFGISVAIEGDTALIGARGNTVFAGLDDHGAAYIFGRNAGGTNNWGEVKRLTHHDPVSNDQLGTSVGLSGDLAVVGAYGKDHPITGAAYVFEKNATGWNQWGEVAKLTASDREARDMFGWRSGIDQGTIVVGAPFDLGVPTNRTGKAFVYEQPRSSLRVYKGDVPESDRE